MTDVRGLHRGFRNDYLDHGEVTAQLKAWAEAFPAFVRLTTLTTTAEGREQWLLTIGREPDRLRPAVWVDGNMHASELCGSSVALAIAEDVIGLHADPAATSGGLKSHMADTLREVLFYVMPRMSPDGAEAVLKTGRYIRSVPRDARVNQLHPHWVSEDIDGDGRALVMRVEDPTGEYVASPDHDGLLLPRSLEDEGPFYKLYPEGRIENFDGVRIPDPSFIGDNEPDLNRNFPYGWAPEYDQIGAGRFPASETESRAVVEFAEASPHIFAWLNLHTFGGVFIRPLGDHPDSKMDPSDLALYRQIEAWGEEFTSYPTVSGFEEFTYEPDKPLHGDLTDWSYHARGCLTYVCELWDLFEQVGLERPKRFVDRYTRLGRPELEKLAAWDREHNQGDALPPWTPVDHPQLGKVEVGGIDPRFGLWNPPRTKLAEVCEQHSAMFLRVAAMAPRVIVSPPAVRSRDGVHEIEVRIENHGYLPTYVLSSAKKLPWNEPLYVQAEAHGCTLADARSAHQSLGHLDGWGRGLYDGSSALYYMRSRGNRGREVWRATVRGTGELRLRIGSCRMGFQELLIPVTDP
ncbi:MAG: M14 family metallopeptidase [Myxococcota bacterium]